MPSFDTSKTIDLRLRATVVETEATELVTAAINDFLEKAADTAAVSPVGPNQKPRMLQLTAWIAHAGEPNLNDRAFTEEDLKEVVDAGLFKAPYFGMIDFNHDFTAYGAWYEASYAYDDEAGAWGILAHGALFAWRYTEIANTVLAMQARQGFIDVSMAAMPGWYEPKETAEGRPYLVVRKPVFFTTSLLDVDPADPKARALGSENPEDSATDRTEALTRAALDNEANHSEEVRMDELKAKIEAALAEITDEREQIVALVTAAMEELPAVRADLESANSENETLTARVAELEAEVASLTEAQATLATDSRTAELALEAARQELDAASEQITALEAFKASVEQAEAEVAEAAKRSARLEQIPEAVLAALENEERDEMIEMWMSQDDATFAKTIKLFSITSAGRMSFAERSARERGVNGQADANEGAPEFALIRKYRRS